MPFYPSPLAGRRPIGRFYAARSRSVALLNSFMERAALRRPALA